MLVETEIGITTMEDNMELIQNIKKEKYYRSSNFISGYLPEIRASLVAQMVKNLPAMQETWVSLEKGMVTHFNIFAWRIPMDRRGWQATVCGVTKTQT